MSVAHIHPRVVIGAIVAGLVVLLGGIWLGGHPADLPSVLRGGPFESRRAEPVTEQALGILTTRYYRPLDRSSLVDVGLSGIVASLDDPYSRYVDPAANKASVSVERANVVTPAALSRMLSSHHVRIGYLRLITFSEGSAKELRAETRTVLNESAQGLILDLRGNGGGLINEAIDVASIFIQSGTIMSAVERNQPRRVYDAHGDAIAAHIPLVVLVDHGTASSAEIVTAALQDHGRAEVVGTHTYGKGVFQITEPLNNGGAIDLSIGQFFTPDGRNLGGGSARQSAGIAPNIYAPSDDGEALGIAERTVAAEVKPASS